MPILIKVVAAGVARRAAVVAGGMMMGTGAGRNRGAEKGDAVVADRGAVVPWVIVMGIASGGAVGGAVEVGGVGEWGVIVKTRLERKCLSGSGSTRHCRCV